MSQEKRRRMKRIDEEVLGADPEKLRRIQELDVRTQLDGVWFYDVYGQHRPLPGRRKGGAAGRRP